jgi:hypothetical protein
MPATLLILAGTNPRELGLAYCRPQGLAVVVASVDCGLDGESSLARVFQAHGNAEVVWANRSLSFAAARFFL